MDRNSFCLNNYDLWLLPEKNRRKKGSQIYYLLQNLSFSVAAGKFLTLMGRSGLGKTALLQHIAGLNADIVAGRGELLLNGKLLQDVPAYQRQIGYMPQKPLLFPFLTVAENLAIAMPKKLNKVEKSLALKNALSDCQLPDNIGTRDPHSLSGGEVARLCLMMLLLAKPKLLLLDEPFAALNFELRRSFKKLLEQEINKRNIPVILVTHQYEDGLGKIITLDK